MKLHDILLKDEISDKFKSPIIFKQLGKEDLSEIAKREPDILYEIGYQALTLYLDTDTSFELQKLNDDLAICNPLIYQKVEKMIKKEIIQDISFSYIEFEKAPSEPSGVVKFSLCRMWPNDLFIADMAYFNPNDPQDEDEQYNDYYFKSPYLFEMHLERLKSYCKENKIDRITLTTYISDQIFDFEELGFKIKKDIYGEKTHEYSTNAIMYLECK